MRYRSVLLILAFVFAPAAAQAQFYIGPQVGQMGIGASASYRVSDLISIDGDFGYLPYKDFSLTFEGNEYDFNNDIQGGFVGISLHPLGGTFAITGGMLLGGWAAEGEAVDGEVTLNDVTYPIGEVGTLIGVVEMEGPTPALMIGFRGRALNWGLGVALIDEVVADLTATGPIASDPTFISNLEAAEQDIIDLVDYGVFPLFRLGWQFRMGDR